MPPVWFSPRLSSFLKVFPVSGRRSHDESVREYLDNFICKVVEGSRYVLMCTLTRMYGHNMCGVFAVSTLVPLFTSAAIDQCASLMTRHAYFTQRCLLFYLPMWSQLT